MGNKNSISVKIVYAFIAIIIYVSPILSQTADTSTNHQVTTLLKLTVGQESGFEWEQKISRTATVSLFAGLGVGFLTDDFDYTAAIAIVPVFNVVYKKYYNLDMRIKNGKSIYHNSGNFLTAKVDIYMPVKDQNYIGIVFSEGWGLQRSINKKINYG